MISTALNINNTFQFEHAYRYANVRSVCPGPTQCPFHTINQRRPTQRRDRNYGVYFGQQMRRMRLRPHTATNTNHTCQIQPHMQQAIQTYALYVRPPRANTAASSYLGSKIVCEIATSCILHQTPIEHLNSSTHTAIETYVLFVQGQHDTSFIHSTNKDQHRAVIIVIVVCAFGQHVRVRFRPHTASKSNNVFKFNHARSNANVRAIRPWHPFHILNKQKSTQTEPSSSL